MRVDKRRNKMRKKHKITKAHANKRMIKRTKMMKETTKEKNKQTKHWTIQIIKKKQRIDEWNTGKKVQSNRQRMIKKRAKKKKNRRTNKLNHKWAKTMNELMKKRM